LKKILLVTILIFSLTGCEAVSDVAGVLIDDWNAYNGGKMARNLCENNDEIPRIFVGSVALNVQAHYGEAGRAAFIRRLERCFPGIRN